MKNFLLVFIAGSSLALAANNANSQGLTSFNSGEKSSRSLNLNASMLHVAGIDEKSNTSFVTAKALKDFKKSYKGATTETWEKIDNGFIAKFTSGEIQNVVYYDKKGNWDASLKNYSENKLDNNVRTLVKQRYFDDKITLVQEIQTSNDEGTPTYIIHLEGKDDFKLIRVCDGEMDVYEQFQKQK